MKLSILPFLLFSLVMPDIAAAAAPEPIACSSDGRRRDLGPRNENGARTLYGPRPEMTAKMIVPDKLVLFDDNEEAAHPKKATPNDTMYIGYYSPDVQVQLQLTLRSQPGRDAIVPLRGVAGSTSTSTSSDARDASAEGAAGLNHKETLHADLSLRDFQVTAVLILFALDAVILRHYLRSTYPTKYPRKAIVFHATGGAAIIGIGLAALAAYQSGRPSLKPLARVLAQIQGAMSVCCLGLASMVLARYTKGRPGYNMVGYVWYAALTVHSGFWCVARPDAQSSWSCFVMIHAYVTCRLCVHFNERVLRWRGDLSYSAATSVASSVVAALACGRPGLLFSLAGVAVASLSDVARIGRLHAIRGAAFCA